MTDVRGRRSSVMLVGLACSIIAAAMLLPRTAGAAVAPCGMTFPQCNGSCPANEACVGLGGGACICFPTGCCQVDAQTCDNDAFEALCPGQFVAAGTCGVDCMPQTPTSTATATATVTPTLVPNGGACDDPADCVSGNCVDDTCCTDPSCPPGQSCDNPGNVGLCSADPVAPAPAISPGGAALAVLALIAIGAIALLRWRRTSSS